MRKILIAILILSLLTRCIPEPDKPERLKYEALQKLKKTGCIFSDPDTSLSGIKIRNSQGAIALIGDKDKADSLDQYHYYSKMDRETLTLTQHPGDGQYQISIFKVEFSDKGIYLIASKDLPNGLNFYPDSNGVIYLPEYCKEKTLTLKIDGKEIPPTNVHFDNLFFESNSSTLSCKVSYRQFYFPLTQSNLSNTLDTGINYKGQVLSNFEYLLATKKIDILRITSCE